MNIFTIITTILNLFICTYAAFKKDNPIYNQQIALVKDPTLIILPHSLRNSVHDDVTYDNYKFKTSILHLSIVVLFGVILVAWFIYGCTTLSVSKESNSLFTLRTKPYISIFFSLLSTAKCTILYIGILACGLICKNFRNIHSSYRIFHIISYSILAISVIGNFVFLLKTDYMDFLPKASISRSTGNLLENLLLSEAPVFLFFQIILIAVCIYKLSQACIFGEYRSFRLRINFRHILERILAPIIFILFTLYIIFLNGHI